MTPKKNAWRFNTGEAVLAAALVATLTYISYKSLSASALRNERAANALTETRLQIGYELFLLAGKSPADYNGSTQDERKSEIGSLTASLPNNEKTARIISRAQLPEFGLPIGLNTSAPTGIWNYQDNRKCGTQISLLLVAVFLLFALRPQTKETPAPKPNSSPNTWPTPKPTRRKGVTCPTSTNTWSSSDPKTKR